VSHWPVERGDSGPSLHNHLPNPAAASPIPKLACHFEMSHRGRAVRDLELSYLFKKVFLISPLPKLPGCFTFLDPG